MKLTVHVEDFHTLNREQVKRKAGNARFHALSLEVDQYAALIKTLSVFRQFFNTRPSLIYFIKFSD